MAGRHQCRAVRRKPTRQPARAPSHAAIENKAFEEKAIDRRSPYRRQGALPRGVAHAGRSGCPPPGASGADPHVGFPTVKTGAARLRAACKWSRALRCSSRNATTCSRAGRWSYTADTAGNPAQARTKTQEVVERLNVAVLIGPLAAFEALAIDDYIRSSHDADPLSGRRGGHERQRSPIRGSRAELHLGTAEPSARRVRRQGPRLKRAAVIADDFAFGHENVAGFQRVFEDNGGKVVQKLFTPLNAPTTAATSRSSSPISTRSIPRHAGSNGFKFIHQLQEYGNKGANPRRLRAGRRIATCSRWAMTRSAP